ncbi:hypothetical protein [Lentilactobacillus farraginis]|uniref:hypothetical protein n=1 Tax=Lentilactobacillus farraginis TaxID=390841 RepID=UPI0005579AC8|nr:hypothetical protein [Lentilactobacillus farraginis]
MDEITRVGNVPKGFKGKSAKNADFIDLANFKIEQQISTDSQKKYPAFLGALTVTIQFSNGTTSSDPQQAVLEAIEKLINTGSARISGIVTNTEA